MIKQFNLMFFILVNICDDFVDPITGQEIETTVVKLDKAKTPFLNSKRVLIEVEVRHLI